MSKNPASVERWFFYQDGCGSWKWARLDIFGTVLDHSGSAFPSREACVDDAARRGYRGSRRAACDLGAAPREIPLQSARSQSQQRF